MNTIAAQEIKRRGIGAVDKALAQGPVRVFKSNQPRYVILSDEDYEELLSDLAEARLAASEADWKAGRVRRGTAKQLMAEILKAD
jgi:PHD/YefM family antitoxin component YafN of YafNO toxin-antitoxin module